MKFPGRAKRVRPPFIGVPPYSDRLIRGYECDSPVAPTELDRLISGYRLTQTALLGDHYYVVSLCASVGLGGEKKIVDGRHRAVERYA